MLQREILEFEGLARADADAGELGADLRSSGSGGQLQREVEILVEVPFAIPSVVAGRKSIVGGAGGAGCFRYAESGCAL